MDTNQPSLVDLSVVFTKLGQFKTLIDCKMID